MADDVETEVEEQADAPAEDASPCLLVSLGEGQQLVYRDGIEGPLTDEQIAQMCTGAYREVPLTDEQIERLRSFDEAAQLCDSRGGSIEEAYTCLEHEMRDRGQRL